MVAHQRSSETARFSLTFFDEALLFGYNETLNCQKRFMMQTASQVNVPTETEVSLTLEEIATQLGLSGETHAPQGVKVDPVLMAPTVTLRWNGTGFLVGPEDIGFRETRHPAATDLPAANAPTLDPAMPPPQEPVNKPMSIGDLVLWLYRNRKGLTPDLRREVERLYALGKLSRLKHLFFRAFQIHLRTLVKKITTPKIYRAILAGRAQPRFRNNRLIAVRPPRPNAYRSLQALAPQSRPRKKLAPREISPKLRLLRARIFMDEHEVERKFFPSPGADPAVPSGQPEAPSPVMARRPAFQPLVPNFDGGSGDDE